MDSAPCAPCAPCATTRTLTPDAPKPRTPSAAKKTAAKKPPKPAATEKKELSPAEKQEMENRIRAKVACDKAAYDVQWALLEPGTSTEALDAAARLLLPAHYNDIVQERALDGLCGYPPCEKEAPKKGVGKQLHVSLSEHKVFDVSHLHNFCGRDCAQKSHLYASTLSSVAFHLRTGSNSEAANAIVTEVKAKALNETPAPSASGSSGMPTATPPTGRPHVATGAAGGTATAASGSAATSASAASAAAPGRTQEAGPVDVSDTQTRPQDSPAPQPAPGRPTAADGSAFDPGATLSVAVRERDPPPPNMSFASVAAPVGTIEGYAVRLENLERQNRDAAKRPEKKAA